MLLLRNILLLTTLLLFSSERVNAQLNEKLIEQNENKKDLLNVKAGFQFWNVYTMDHKLYNEALGEYSEGYNNWSSLIRRARVNAKFQAYKQLILQGNISADQIGKDNNSATQGGKANSGKSISILDLYARYSITKSSDHVVLTVGLQRPMIGRETVVSSLRTSSLEKSISQYYQRKQIVGSGNGRTVGVNIGGQFNLSVYSISIKYNIGSFATPSFFQEDDIYSTSPLFAGRLGIDIGDPESTSYSTNSKTNYFGNRNGLTLSTSFSYQGQTSIFNQSSSLGFDFLFNRGYLNIDGELFFLFRANDINQINMTATSNGGYLRAGYTLSTYKKQYLEPVIMYTFFAGGTSEEEIMSASQLNAFNGSDYVLELGFNYYLSSLVKLSLFYTVNKGNSDPYLETNNFNHIDSIGREIQRGDKLAFAITINI